jgi:23S rRNA (cytosine1962-C5)-methyltransferase
MLPGIKVNLLKDQVLIQFYSFFWENYEDFIINSILISTQKYLELELYKENIWIQYRADSGKKKTPPKCLDPNLSFKTISLSEYNVQYEIHLGKNYDPGIYTDMSAIREDLSDLFKKSEKVLNLFAYTGAFSMFAFAQGAKHVCSVDISEAYMQELIENIKLNKFQIDHHKDITASVTQGLKSLQKDNASFDLIISDPPTSSSDKKKRTNALRDYEQTLPMMYQLLAEGGSIVGFFKYS